MTQRLLIKSAALLVLLSSVNAYSFCGFYVAKADATLFNNKSEIILVRDGTRTSITMSNDFKGDVRDFAMVVPVPVVLQEGDIKVVDRRIFETLDAYSSPRLVEYYDTNPCYQAIPEVSEAEFYPVTTTNAGVRMMYDMVETKFNVTIEAEYTVGEYDIALLSAKESTGLKNYLIQEGYKIPSSAESVLEPYIKSNMKFFVVKVNLDKQKNTGFDYLRPIQINFDHPKFMLPIRLGMANSTGEQDMIVYAFTKTGRVECTNYRTVKVPTDRNIPLYTKDIFGEFYKNLFTRAYSREGKNAVMLEYAWNVTPSWGGMKCDPCVGNPPIYNDFAEAGVWWAGWNSASPVFFTRLHVRYSNAKFPADLTFQITPNTENFQARYILTHPASGSFDCDESQEYLESLRSRRKVEVDELYALAGIKPNDRSDKYINEFVSFMRDKPLDSMLKGEALPSNNSPMDPSEIQVDEAYIQSDTDPNEAFMQNKDSDKNKKPWEVPIFLGSVVGLVLFVSRKRAKK
jgi:hypothetical protein